MTKAVSPYLTLAEIRYEASIFFRLEPRQVTFKFKGVAIEDSDLKEIRQVAEKKSKIEFQIEVSQPKKEEKTYRVNIRNFNNRFEILGSCAKIITYEKKPIVYSVVVDKHLIQIQVTTQKDMVYFVRELERHKEFNKAFRFAVIGIEQQKVIKSSNSESNLKDEEKEVFYKKKEHLKPGFLPSVRISSPYLSQAEMERRKEKESRKKWISKQPFKSFVVKSQVEEIRNYVSMSQSKSPLLHDFREVNRRKWKNGSNFKIF